MRPGQRFRISGAEQLSSVKREEAHAKAQRIGAPIERLAAAYDLTGDGMPELFVRHGDVSLQPELKDAVLNVVRFVPDAEVMADLDGCVAWARESGEGDPDKVAITGFCWGGRTVWLYAAHNAELRAGVDRRLELIDGRHRANAVTGLVRCDQVVLVGQRRDQAAKHVR